MSTFHIFQGSSTFYSLFTVDHRRRPRFYFRLRTQKSEVSRVLGRDETQDSGCQDYVGGHVEWPLVTLGPLPIDSPRTLPLLSPRVPPLVGEVTSTQIHHLY